MTVQHSRFGELTGTWELNLGGGSYGNWAHVGGTEARRAFREMVIDVLQETSPLGRNALFKKLRERKLKGTDDTWRDWLAQDTADGSTGFAHDDQLGYSLRVSEQLGLGVGERHAHPRRSPSSPKGAGRRGL